MPFVSRQSLLSVAVLSALAVVVAGGFVWSGLYDVGADDRHTRPVYALLATLRDRSIAVRVADLEVPDLRDPALIREGAGNYDAMCTGCHLAPGRAATELSRGLNPAPPAFATAARGDPARHFWVVKHGIKASGMPAWGISMEDRYLWGMVAFIQQLPDLDAAAYRALVAESGGHAHGGGETPAHDGAPPDQHAAAPDDAPAPATMTHRHADGTVESHPVEAAPAGDEAADQTAGHHDDHEH